MSDEDDRATLGWLFAKHTTVLDSLSREDVLRHCDEPLPWSKNELIVQLATLSMEGEERARIFFDRGSSLCVMLGLREGHVHDLVAPLGGGYEQARWRLVTYMAGSDHPSAVECVSKFVPAPPRVTVSALTEMATRQRNKWLQNNRTFSLSTEACVAVRVEMSTRNVDCYRHIPDPQCATSWNTLYELTPNRT